MFATGYEAWAVIVAGAEALAGIVAGAVAAIESHKPGSHPNTPHAPDDDDDPDDPGGGSHDPDTPAYRYIEHAEVMEISHANEVGHNYYKEARKKRLKRLQHHVRQYAWEYGALLPFAGVKLWNRYHRSMQNQQTAHERRVAHNYYLRQNAPHLARGTPPATPQKKRQIRAIADAFDPHLGFRVRRYH